MKVTELTSLYPDSNIVGQIVKKEDHYYAFIEYNNCLLCTFGNTFDELLFNIKDAKACYDANNEDGIEFNVNPKKV